MSERVSTHKRDFAKQLRKSSTQAELTLWRLLRSRRLANAKFRRQVPIGPWIVDFVSFEHRLVIEADGSQHTDSLTDPCRAADLKTRGFRILRFWNNDILGRPASVTEAIWSVLQAPPHPAEPPPAFQPPSPTRGEGEGPPFP